MLKLKKQQKILKKQEKAAVFTIKSRKEEGRIF